MLDPCALFSNDCVSELEKFECGSELCKKIKRGLLMHTRHPTDRTGVMRRENLNNVAGSQAKNQISLPKKLKMSPASNDAVQ